MLKVNTPVIINSPESHHYQRKGIIETADIGNRSHKNIYGVRILYRDGSKHPVLTVMFDEDLTQIPPDQGAY